ncbi:jg12371 [Pararge aegeria aegeria]|uniref:Jg12371 protein n=1 Tax=Pararge aegeria aegeria TaxID=348720 RepID=A0A8S4SDU7_9NEOP|nr:jg12371 [Pararge aegeria aegeria]
MGCYIPQRLARYHPRLHHHLPGITDSPLCRACMKADETPTHVLLRCRGVAQQRAAYLGSPASIPEALGDLGGLLIFCEECSLAGWSDPTYNGRFRPTKYEDKPRERRRRRRTLGYAGFFTMFSFTVKASDISIVKIKNAHSSGKLEVQRWLDVHEKYFSDPSRAPLRPATSNVACTLRTSQNQVNYSYRGPVVTSKLVQIPYVLHAPYKVSPVNPRHK